MTNKYKPAITVQQNIRRKYNKAYNLLKSYSCYNSGSIWLTSDGHPLGLDVHEAAKSLIKLKGLNPLMKKKEKDKEENKVKTEDIPTDIYKCTTCYSFKPTICAACKEHVNLVFVNCPDTIAAKDDMNVYLIRLVKHYYNYKDGKDVKTMKDTMDQLVILAQYMEGLKKDKADGLFIYEDYSVV